MKQKSYLIVLLLTMLLACTEEVKVTPYDYPKVFSGDTQRSWVVRNYQIIREGKGPLTGGFEDCLADDIYTFYWNADMSAKVTNGRLKCSQSEPDLISESNWSFSNATSTLTFVFPPLSSGPIPFIVKEVDDTKMTIDIYLNEDNSAAYRFNFRTVSGE